MRTRRQCGSRVHAQCRGVTPTERENVRARHACACCGVARFAAVPTYGARKVIAEHRRQAHPRAQPAVGAGSKGDGLAEEAYCPMTDAARASSAMGPGPTPRTTTAAAESARATDSAGPRVSAPSSPASGARMYMNTTTRR